VTGSKTPMRPVWSKVHLACADDLPLCERGDEHRHVCGADTVLAAEVGKHRIEVLPLLTGWVSDRTAKKRMEADLGLLLSQGRTVGVVVVGAEQDPRKDVLPMRDLFPPASPSG
jgi:hypothetical protein